MSYSYDLLRVLRINGEVKKTDWYCFWWLDRPLDKSDLFLDIKELLAVTKSKGRFKGGNGPFVDRLKQHQRP